MLVGLLQARTYVSLVALLDLRDKASQLFISKARCSRSL